MESYNQMNYVNIIDSTDSAASINKHGTNGEEGAQKILNHYAPSDHQIHKTYRLTLLFKTPVFTNLYF